MVNNSVIFSMQLKEACKVAGAVMALWLLRKGTRWEIYPRESFSRTRREKLIQLIHQQSFSEWLAGSLMNGRVRSRNLGDDASILGCSHFFLFPNTTNRSIVMVGADSLTKNQRDLFRVLALSCPSESPVEGISSDEEALLPSFLPEIETSFELDQILDLVLRVLVERVSCQSAFLVIHSGDLFRIEATWGCPEGLKGEVLSPDSIRSMLQRAGARQGEIHSLIGGESQFLEISKYLGKPLCTAMNIPIMVGNREIGEVVFASSVEDEFTQADLKLSTQYLGKIAPAIENAINFTETGRYLQQMSLLNELAMAASGDIDTDEVARRVVRWLRRTFTTEQAAVLLLTKDLKTLLEYGGVKGIPPLVIPVNESLAGFVVETMSPIRLGDIREAPRFYPPSPEVHSALFVPLMYRSEVIGTICLQSNLPNAFTVRDEQLLVVIASHLAGLFQYVRLNQEARERAGKLALIHQVAQQVVGLTSEAEITRMTTELTADYFKYELAVVLLADESGDQLVVSGSGGSMAHLVPPGFTYPVTRGITGQVFRQARGNYYNDVLLNEVYFPLPGWQAGSEMCVPLRDGDAVIGVINVERAQKHSFTHGDLLVLESLAGILSSVILSAQRYRELQKRIEAQREAENRLIRSARLAAVGEMAAGIAHELNNPLTSVIGFVELAMDELDRESSQFGDLDLALREAQRAREVVRHLLDFSRQSGNIRILSDLNEVLHDVLKLLHHQFQTTGIQLDLEFGELPPILINPNQIKQVALNLLYNALQAMQEGGTLSLQTGVAQHSGQPSAFFTVIDTGEGISPEAMERIFEPFFTTRDVGKGTGLGLSVSYGIVTSHGGHIEVKSALGQGSCFTVWLPVQ